MVTANPGITAHEAEITGNLSKGNPKEKDVDSAHVGVENYYVGK